MSIYILPDNNIYKYIYCFHEISKKKYDFAIGFIIVLALNIAIYIAAQIIFKNRPDDANAFAFSRSLNMAQTIAYACLLVELTFFGLVQYLYVLPLAYWQSKKGNLKVEGGIYISSFVVLVINCCWAYISLNPIG